MMVRSEDLIAGSYFLDANGRDTGPLTEVKVVDGRVWCRFGDYVYRHVGYDLVRSSKMDGPGEAIFRDTSWFCTERTG